MLLLPLWTCSGRGSRRAKEGDGGHATRWQSCWLVCCLPLPTMLFHHAPFFPLNAFYSNFKASPALFSHFFLFHPCFAWLCLWSRIGPGIKKHGYWKRKLAGFFFPSLSFFPSSSPPDFCILHLARQQPRGRFFFCLRPAGFFSARWEEKAYLACWQIASESLPPRFAVAASVFTFPPPTLW